MEFAKCPVCKGTHVMVIERGEAEKDTLTGEMWFVDNTQFFCRCMNEDCIHDSECANTYEKAIENWNKGIIPKWEQKWIKTRDEPISDFY